MSKEKEKTSPVWIHFEQDKTEKTNSFCKLCKAKGLKKCYVKKNDGTRNLWQHLENHHKREWQDLKTKENENKALQNEKPKTTKQLQQKTLLDMIDSDQSKAANDKRVAYMIALDLQPYQVVERIGNYLFIINYLKNERSI